VVYNDTTILWRQVYYCVRVPPDVTKTSKSDSQGSKSQDITTIKVSRETWARNRRKTGPGESFDDIVGDLLAAVEDDDGPSE